MNRYILMMLWLILWENNYLLNPIMLLINYQHLNYLNIKISTQYHLQINKKTNYLLYHHQLNNQYQQIPQLHNQLNNQYHHIPQLHNQSFKAYSKLYRYLIISYIKRLNNYIKSNNS